MADVIFPVFPPAPFGWSQASLLAVDTSTERLSLALCHDGQLWRHEGAGGAQASSTLIPAIFALLARAGVALDDLDALVLGRGPGSFSGLRTAASVVQGLALGARQGQGLPVLPLDTLMAVADEARWLLSAQPADGDVGAVDDVHAAAVANQRHVIAAVLDARMGEVYQQAFVLDGNPEAPACQPLEACRLVRPEAWRLPAGCTLVAGNALALLAGHIPAEVQQVPAWPSAAALLRLAPAYLAAGHGGDAAAAVPLYVRNKVAQTTEERMAAKTQPSPASTTAPAAASAALLPAHPA